jgi:hypothetical protein
MRKEKNAYKVSVKKIQRKETTLKLIVIDKNV